MSDAATPISIVCSDLSENCLGRAEVLVEVLSGFGPVHIVGPQLQAEIWRPAQSSRIPMRGFALRSAFSYPRAARWLRRELAGTRVVVSKPRSTSFGLTLAAGVGPNQMALDIDDWELGFMKPAATTPGGRLGFVVSKGTQLLAHRSLNSYAGIRLLDTIGNHVPRRIVSNSWLQQRFGGVIVPHVRDTHRLDPTQFRAQAAERRAEQQMGDRMWIGFVGTIREHKGVDDLVAAVANLTGERAPGLFLAGVDFEHAFSKTVLAQARAALPEARLRVLGAFDSGDLPGWVAAADVICIPSRDIPGTWGQIPAKLFDAMSMAKPIVAANVGDMGRIVEGCGLLFPAGDIAALSERLARVTADTELRARLGETARSRAIAEFSVDSGRRAVRKLILELPPFLPKP